MVCACGRSVREWRHRRAGLLIGDAEKARCCCCCQLDCALEACERRDSVEGRTARRHRAIEAMMGDERVVRVG